MLLSDPRVAAQLVYQKTTIFSEHFKFSSQFAISVGSLNNILKRKREYVKLREPLFCIVNMLLRVVTIEGFYCNMHNIYRFTTLRHMM